MINDSTRNEETTCFTVFSLFITIITTVTELSLKKYYAVHVSHEYDVKYFWNMFLADVYWLCIVGS